MQRIFYYYAYAALSAALALGELAAWQTTAMAIFAIVMLLVTVGTLLLVLRARKIPAATMAAATAMMFQLGLTGALSTFAIALRENQIMGAQKVLAATVFIATIAMWVLVLLPTRQERGQPFNS